MADDIRTAITGLILAGGRGSRMDGADKGWVTYEGRPLVASVMERFGPQVGQILISANRNLDVYADYGWPVVPDGESGYPGPLAGILAGAGQARHDWLLVVPCDTPFLPETLAERMLDRGRMAAVPLVRAGDATRIHYAVMLLHRTLVADLTGWLKAGERRVQAWQARHAHTEARFEEPPWAFLNINTPEDLRQAESHLRR